MGIESLHDLTSSSSQCFVLRAASRQGWRGVGMQRVNLQRWVSEVLGLPFSLWAELHVSHFQLWSCAAAQRSSMLLPCRKCALIHTDSHGTGAHMAPVALGQQKRAFRVG